MQRARGFTLWELLCTVAVVGIALGTGVPAFRAFLLDARLTADVNGWVLAVQVARSEAAKRGRSVIACGTENGSTCSSHLHSGWMVFVNLDDVSPPRRDEAEPLLLAFTADVRGSITSNRPYYEFRMGRRSTNGTIVFCDERGSAAARAVIVSFTGRPRVSNRDADGRPLQCARLT